MKNLFRTLSKKRRFRTPFDSQHVKASQILAKSPSLLKILGAFVKTLTADGKYLIQDGEDLELPIQMQLSQNEKHFLNFLFHFLNLHQMLNILIEKMIVRANVFPNFHTVKNVFTTLSKRHHSEHALTVNM